MSAIDQLKPDTISQITSWFEKAVPRPTYTNAHAQLAVHLEEVSEMVTALFLSASNERSTEHLAFLASVLDFTRRQLRDPEQGVSVEFEFVNREDLLDSLCDQIVTAVGLAHMLGMDLQGALAEVSRSNDSKFDDEGQPIFNEAHKIMKGPNYTPPNLSAYT